MDEDKHLTEFINGFVTKNQRRRLLELAETPKGRGKMISKLAHDLDLDPRYLQEIPPKLQSRENILRSLRGKGAGKTCYALSELDSIDGKIVPLDEALSQILGFGWGTVLSCIPGKLAYYEGEEMNCRYILER